MSNLLFAVHSKCHDAHWELLVKDDYTIDLVCEECGQSFANTGKTLEEELDRMVRLIKAGVVGCSKCEAGEPHVEHSTPSMEDPV